MVNLLGLVARHGRYALVVGLVAGVILQDLAQVLKPWLPHLIALLMFLTALRIGPKAAANGLRKSLPTVRVALIYQFALPLAALVMFSIFGIAQTPLAIALTLMLAAPAITGGPPIAALLGYNPEPTFRILLLGTALLPLTIIPIFWLSPALGDLGAALWASLRLLLVIWSMAALAFVTRHIAMPNLQQRGIAALDGIMAIALAVVVIALMAALGPAFKSNPATVLGWLVLAFAANLGLQAAAFYTLRKTSLAPSAASLAVVAGNRNFALFLIAMPAAATDPLLIFLGCYQFPMYLTAILMRPVYGEGQTA